MSQLQKLRAKQNKVKVLFSVEKTVEGLEISVKSPKLGKLVKEFYDEYKYAESSNFNDHLVNPIHIVNSINYDLRRGNNTIVYGASINMSILKYLMSGKTSKTVLIKNVFTNGEIKKYIELFETYLIKIKQLYNDKKITLSEVIEN